jgi:hypothetical protein
MAKKKLRKNWYIGFFGLFASSGIVGIGQNNPGLLAWFLGILWFLFFIPVKQESKS